MHYCEGSNPHIRLSSLGIQQRDRESPENLTVKTSRTYRTSTGLGKTETLGGHKQNLVHTRTLEKGAVTSQETDPNLPVSVQESPGETWINSGRPWGKEH